MSSYWDSIRTEVNTLAKEHKANQDAFVEQVRLVEDRVLHTVNLTTGDREFPDDLRERIQGVIAIKSLQANERLAEMAPYLDRLTREPEETLRQMCYHELFEDLHSIFHDVARRRQSHRFGGMFSDNPDGFLRIRDEALNDTDAGGSETG